MKPQNVLLHPESLRHLAKGHPWVIKDKYTESIKAKERFISAQAKGGQQFLLLGDTAHPRIKARLWKTLQGEHDFDFYDELRCRLEDAVKKRLAFIKSPQRQNLFLAFGEADYLPGLFLLLLKDGLVIQSYARFWKKFQKDLMPMIRSVLEEQEIPLSWIAWQERDLSKDTPLTPLWRKMPQEIQVQEYGVTYLIKLTQSYDIGLYTDMAAIRDNLNYNWQGKRILNLYCYTGAWSLYPLAQGASHVTSIDLSEKYINWLEENLKLNPQLAAQKHCSIISDVKSALKELKRQGESFDFIFCDPPSFSSDGKKTSTSLKAYKELIPLFEDLLNKQGEALCFINTHSVTRAKFEDQMAQYLKASSFKQKDHHKLQGDCPLLKNFPEGDYLKGVRIIKN